MYINAVLILERNPGARPPFGGSGRLVLAVRAADESGDRLNACAIDPDAALNQAVLFDARVSQQLLQELVALVRGGDTFVSDDVPVAGKEMRFHRRQSPPAAAASGGTNTPRPPSQNEDAPQEPPQSPAATETPEDQIVVIPDPGPTGGNGPKIRMVAFVRMFVALNDVAGNIEEEGSDPPKHCGDAISPLQ